MKKRTVKKVQKCVICGLPVDEKKEWSTNGAVYGDFIELTGHEKCVTSVDNLIIIPNRIRILDLEEKTPRGKLSRGETIKAIHKILNRAVMGCR